MSDFYSEISKSQLSPNYSIISQLSYIKEKEDELEFISAFKNIFSPKKSPGGNEEDKIHEEELYFIKEKVDTNLNSEKSTKSQTTIIKKNLFNTKKEEGNKLTKKKRGRSRKKKFFDAINDVKNIHDKYSMDNLLRKIQVHFLNFIISYLNDILKELNYKEQLLKINYKFKRNINKKFLDGLKNKKISDIVCIDISTKYQKHDKNTNKKIYEIIKNNKIINNILNKSYIEPFYIYYKSKKNINLKNYGFDKEIILSQNSKMFKDLILKEVINNRNDKNYIKKLNFCLFENYPIKDKFLMYDQTI